MLTFNNGFTNIATRDMQKSTAASFISWGRTRSGIVRAIYVGAISMGHTTTAMNHLALATTPVFLLDGDREIVQGSGFLYGMEYQHGTVGFLVTNYHVLTGSSPLADQSPKGDTIIFQVHRDMEHLEDVKTVRLPLFARYQRPIWITDTRHPAVDMALVPLPASLVDDDCVWILSQQLAARDDTLDPESHIMVIGYPSECYDISGGQPAWRTGTLIHPSTPEGSSNLLFMVDVSTVPGLSGAPVFAMPPASAAGENNVSGRHAMPQLLGVYASRVPGSQKKYLEELSCDPNYNAQQVTEMAQSLQVGNVWKAWMIEEAIIRADIDRTGYETQHYHKVKMLFDV